MRRAGAGGPVVAGAAFAVAWTPCAGPTLGSILAAAATGDVGQGGDPAGLLLGRAGRAVPAQRARLRRASTGAFRWFRDHYGLIAVVSGVILIVMGVLLYTGQLTQLNGR